MSILYLKVKEFCRSCKRKSTKFALDTLKDVSFYDVIFKELIYRKIQTNLALS